MASRYRSSRQEHVESMPDKHQEICGRFAKLLSDLRRLNRDGSESRRFRSQPSQPASTDTDVTNKETGVRKPGTDSDAKAKDCKDVECVTEFSPSNFGSDSSDSCDEPWSDTECSKVRLHESIPFNKRMKDKNSQNCTCSSAHRRKWAVHNIFKGEKLIPRCNPHSGNVEKLRCYSLSVTPLVNFEVALPTRIKYHGKKYNFQGYFILSHFSLKAIPKCDFVMYKRKYVIEFTRESMPQNFNIRELDLFHELVFEEFFNIFDWNLNGEPDGCRRFHFLPRFVLSSDCKRSRHEKRDECLPMSAVLEHIVSRHEPLVKHHHLKKTRSDWHETGSEIKNSLLLFPGRKPCCLRVDGLDLQRTSQQIEEYPLVVHSTRSATITLSGRRYERLKRKRDNLQYFQDDCVLPDKTITHRSKKIEHKMRDIKEKHFSKKSFVKITSKECYKTGLKTDIFQHCLLVYIAVNHIRYQKSLDLLESRVNYSFKDRRILETSLRLASLPKKITNFSNILTSSFNCGLLEVDCGDGSEVEGHSRKRGLSSLQYTMSKLGESKFRPSTVSHNESLEFLGDAILEFITSRHLFFMFGSKTEGELSKYRSLLVENFHLADIAKRLEIEDFILLGHGDWKSAKLDHTFANCIEAILAAIYLDGGYAKAEQFVASIFFKEDDLHKIWTDIPKHMLQERAPGGDRQLIHKSVRLQQLVKLEEQLGLQFTHISLLARAFTCQADEYDTVTGGDNERLEFLGDSLLKFIISEMVFRRFPEHNEGHLTLLRTTLVNAQTQAELFAELGLDKYIDGDSTSKTQRNHKFYANFFEAFLGAVYVDKGMEYCRKICEVTMLPKLETFILNGKWIDPKSELQNCCSYKRREDRKGENPVYKILETIGPVPYRKYKVAVYFQDEEIGVGMGPTIKSAELSAARNALESNHFEVAEKQKRVLHRKYGRKRPRVAVGESSNKATVGEDSNDDNAEWSPKWIDL